MPTRLRIKIVEDKQGDADVEPVVLDAKPMAQNATRSELRYYCASRAPDGLA